MVNVLLNIVLALLKGDFLETLLYKPISKISNLLLIRFHRLVGVYVLLHIVYIEAFLIGIALVLHFCPFLICINSIWGKAVSVYGG